MRESPNREELLSELIARQKARIEQVRIHLDLLATNTSEARRTSREFSQMLVVLRLLEALRGDRWSKEHLRCLH